MLREVLCGYGYSLDMFGYCSLMPLIMKHFQFGSIFHAWMVGKIDKKLLQLAVKKKLVSSNSSMAMSGWLSHLKPSFCVGVLKSVIT